MQNSALIALLAGSTFLVACGGGGGGGATSNVRPDPVEESEPVSYNTDHLTTIKASAAWAAGARGEGITIAVLDTGVRATHDEFENRVSEQSALIYYDEVSETVVTDTSGVGDLNGHGTHVASLALGANVGVAPAATLLAVKATDDNAHPQSGLFGDALAYARANNARVFNWSMNPQLVADDRDTLFTELRGVATDDGVLVWAAGNTSADLSEVIANELDADDPLDPHSVALVADADGVDYAGLADHVLYVGALTRDGKLADFSGRPGANPQVQARFLLAPGEFVSGADHRGNGDYLAMSGTSMAAPQVAGAAALLMGTWPHLGGAEAAQILLDTADDAIADYDPALHGQGVLDLQAAMAPVGELTVLAGARVSDGGATLAESRLVLGHAFGDALQDAPLLAQAAVFDTYARDFRVDLGAQVSPLATEDLLADFFVTAAQPQLRVEHTSGGYTLAAAYRTGAVADADALWQGEGQALERLAFGTEQWSLQALANPARTGANAFGHNGEAALLTGGLGFNPYLALTDQAAGGEYRLPLGLTSHLSLSLWQGATDFGESLGERDSRLTEIGYHFQSGAGQYRLGFGQYSQEGGLFGSYGAGALAAGDASLTQAVSLSGHWGLTGPVSGFAQVSQGRTRVSAAQSALLSSFDGLTSESLAAGVQVQGEAHRFGAVYSQPLRVSAGSAYLAVPVGREMDGTLRYAGDRVSLTPSGREQRLELFYQSALSDSAALKLNLMHRLEPGHRAGAPAETLVAVGYQSRF